MSSKGKNSNIHKHKIMEMIGESMLYASVNVSIGSVSMSSAFSVRNFSKDQLTLQNACDSLSEYILIAMFWAIGVVMLLFAKYGIMGAITGLISNLLVMGWIFFSYMHAFKTAAKMYGLKMPTYHFFHWNLADVPENPVVDPPKPSLNMI
jgi:hypothetical protein